MLGYLTEDISALAPAPNAFLMDKAIQLLQDTAQ
jgi:hypothetical protein